MVLALSFLPSRRVEKQARELMKSTCAVSGAAVRYDGWQGTVHTFKFENSTFAEAFSTANAKKVLSGSRQV